MPVDVWTDMRPGAIDEALSKCGAPRATSNPRGTMMAT
jgi:hypothetical protein